MKEKAFTKKVIVEHNEGDSQRKGEGDIRLANLQIKGKGKDTAILILPCFNSIKGTIIKRLTVEFENPVDLESTSDAVRNQWQKGVNLAKMNLKEEVGWPPNLIKGMEEAIQIILLGYPNRTDEEDIKKFYDMLDKHRDEITEKYGRYRDAYKKKESEVGWIKMKEIPFNAESAILEKYPDAKDKELMDAVIKKVLDEDCLYEEQSYGEKVIKEHLEIVKERVKEASQKKDSRSKRYKRK